MKKIFQVIVVVLGICLLGNPLYAQESQKHIEFRGIPVSGNLNTFVGKLGGLGYKVAERSDNAVLMEGKFTGKDVEIIVFSSKKTKTVWKVLVRFDKATSWSSLKYDYEYYKSAFTKKYGNPETSYEFFSDPYYEGDGYELQAVRVEKCHYVSFYNTEGGVVYIEMDKSERLCVHYEDSVGTEKQKKERDEAVIDDI